MTLIKCDKCQTKFNPNFAQLNFINSSKQKGMTFIMLACNNCGMSFPFNPKNPESLNFASQDILIRTPLSGSHGYISFIDDEENKFYGCGETGTIWRKKKNLFRDIELIVRKYPHRELCYLKTTSGWIANPDEPSDMDVLIDKEIVEVLNNFERD